MHIPLQSLNFKNSLNDTFDLKKKLFLIKLTQIEKTVSIGKFFIPQESLKI